MKVMQLASLVVVAALLVTLTGCGVSKGKYDALVTEKKMLEGKLVAISKVINEISAERDKLAAEKEILASQVATLGREKEALREEYDKILDEKIALQAAAGRISETAKGKS